MRAYQRLGPLLYACCALFFVLVHCSVEPYDDSYFFKRVAAHFLEYGVLAWNLAEGPTYSNTSLGWQALAIPVAAYASDHVVIVTRLLSWVMLVGAYAILWRLHFYCDRGIAVTLCFASPLAFYPLLSGMETAATFLLLAVVAWLSFARQAQRLHWILRPLAVNAVYLMRPDAALLALALIISGKFDQPSRPIVRELASTALFLALCLTGCWLVFGTALPLPFYAKQAAFSPYDAGFVQMSRDSGWARFCVFLFFAMPALIVAAARRDRVNITLLLGAGTHALYHQLFTIDIMGMHGRFYVPELVLLALAGARGLAASYRRHFAIVHVGSAFYVIVMGTFAFYGLLAPQSSSNLDRIPWLSTLATATSMLLALVALARIRAWPRIVVFILLVAIASQSAEFRYASIGWRSDDEFLKLHVSRSTIYRGLDTLRACFGDTIRVYHSEVGVPGLRFLHGEIVDLAGLMSTKWLFRAPGSFDALCQADRPQAIFLPHRNYVELNREIQSSSCLKGYQRMVEKSSSPLFVRRDLAQRFLQCADEQRDRWISENPSSR